MGGVGGKRETWIRRMNAGAVLTEDIPLSNYRSGGIRVSIEPGKDSFSADNTAYGYIREPIGVLLVTDGNPYLEDLLRLDPTVEASVCAPSEYRETKADVYVFDRFAPLSAPSKPCLIFRPADWPNWLVPTTGQLQAPPITKWNKSHPVMQHVSLHDVHIESAARTTAGSHEVLVASGDTPLVIVSQASEVGRASRAGSGGSAGENGGNADAAPEWVLAGFAIEDTDFHLNPAFPIFVRNTMDWLQGTSAVHPQQIGRIEVRRSNARIHASNGEAVPVRHQLGRTLFWANQPGIFAVTSSGVRQHLAVNIADHAISDVNRSAFAKGIEPQPEPEGSLLYPTMVLWTVVLILLEWWTYHRGLTI